MCNGVTLDYEQDAGSVLSLCDDPARCLVELFRLDPNTSAGRVFAAMAQPHSLAIVEWTYFDIDYRSEFTATHETSFVRDPNASRVNFFAAKGPQHPTALYDALTAAKDTYRGYCVIRPQVVGAIGRSMITTDAVLWHPKNDALTELRPGKHLHEFVRTAVVEDVEVFGVPLRVIGIPFMQQDQHLLRCAHVSAWACHYSAVLRGVVPRRPSAHFHLAEDSTGAYGRSYPSDGLSTLSLSHILRRLDLPPEILTEADLTKHPKPQWYTHRPLVKYLSEHAPDSEEVSRAFVAHNLTTTLCRYLNSGIPVILSREQQPGHTQVVCGYLRQEDVENPSKYGDELTKYSDVVAFVASDDAEGPYIPVPVDDLVSEVLVEDTKLWPLSVIIPLPHGLWLTGAAAERGGARALRSAALKRLPTLDPWLAAHGLTDQLDQHRAMLEKVVDEATGDVTVRSYAMLGSDFKTGFLERVDDEALRRVVARTPLPKYVWTVELVDRNARETSAEHVLGTVVLDASAVVGGATRTRNVLSLLIHIPGQVTIPRPEALYEDAHWTLVSPTPYRSGRVVDWTKRRPTTRFKTAITPTTASV